MGMEAERVTSAATSFVKSGVIPRPDIWKVYGDCRCLFRALCRACDDPQNNIRRDAKGQPIEDRPRIREQTRADDLRAQLCIKMRQSEKEVSGLLAGEHSV